MTLLYSIAAALSGLDKTVYDLGVTILYHRILLYSIAIKNLGINKCVIISFILT